MVKTFVNDCNYMSLFICKSQVTVVRPIEQSSKEVVLEVWKEVLDINIRSHEYMSSKYSLTVNARSSGFSAIQLGICSHSFLFFNIWWCWVGEVYGSDSLLAKSQP